MSQENVEWARQVAEALTRGDVEAVEALSEGRLAPDFEIHPLYLDRVYRGDEAVRQMWADLTETWEDYRAEFEEVVDLGEHVLTLIHITARGVGSGVPIDQRIAVLARFQGENALWLKSFRSKEEALEAAGLSE
jgi:ketosteroid isomerase-like protein